MLTREILTHSRSLKAVDAVVVGSGPNGLAAAIEIARAGRSIVVVEAQPTLGGGTRSDALTLPGFVHDVCSSAHPLLIGSPFFGQLPLAEHGLRLIQPATPLAHPFDDGSAATLERSLDETCAALGPDGLAYGRLVGPLVARWRGLVRDLLAPLRLPRHPLALAWFGPPALLPATLLARAVFRGQHARGLFAGLAAHSILPLDRPLTSAFGLMLGTLGHAVGWPVAGGGSQRIADALAAYLARLGGEIVVDRPIDTLADLPASRAALFDVSPRQFLRIAGEALPPKYRSNLAGFRYGPGVFKMDWALDGPIPWRAAACQRAGTVHLGGSLDEITASERAAWRGWHTEQPCVILIQASVFDPDRAPSGKHTAWAYCHVPHASTEDMSQRIEAQIERFAPGFQSRVLARSVMRPADLERRNANLVGGAIGGGVQDLFQHFTRPVARLVPYTTPHPRLFLCSASTPPGGGVHGMCGYFAARAALRTALR
jgi:phytoene dehydrogenase-like protein